MAVRGRLRPRAAAWLAVITGGSAVIGLANTERAGTGGTASPRQPDAAPRPGAKPSAR